MANENFDSQSSEMPKGFPGGVLVNTFTMVEENFDSQSSEMPKSEGFP